MIIRAVCLIVVLAALSVSAQTNDTPACCRYPFRTLGSRGTVDLTPLFQWWTSHGGLDRGSSNVVADYNDPTRPLTRWKRITGIKTAELDGAWVVNAEIYTRPGSRTNRWIILSHPPVAEEQEYYNLQTLLGQYNQQIADSANAREADGKAAQKESDRAARVGAAFAKSDRAYAGIYSQRAAELRTAAAGALADQEQYKKVRDQIVQQLRALPGVRGRYELDCFALEMGLNSRGQMVYEVGGAVGYTQ